MNIKNVKNLYHLCKLLRISLNMPVVAVATYIGVGTGCVYSFERGKSKNMYVLQWYIDHGLYDFLENNKELIEYEYK